MKLLMISDYFPPEIGSASFLFYELAKKLIAQGDQVSIITGFPRYNIDKKTLEPRYRKGFMLNEKVDGINVFRVRTIAFPRKINILRGIDQFTTAFIYFFRALFVKRYDYVLIYSPPLPLGLTGYLLKIIKRKKVILNVQDLFPQSAIDLGAMRNKLLVNFFTTLEKFIYLKNDYITVHSPGNMEHVLNVTAGKIHAAVVPNWVNTKEIMPGDKNNEFSREYSLEDKFVISFAGVLGESQDFDIILKAAKALRSNKDIVFVIVGDGRKKLYLEKMKYEENIDNLIIAPMQIKEKYPLVLHSSNIGLVTLRKEVSTPVVPSKILSIMSAGIPIVASLHLWSDAAKIITNSHAGICVEAGDANGFVNAIDRIHKDWELKNMLGNNGRKHVERNYSLDICSDRYEKIFSSFNRI